MKLLFSFTKSFVTFATETGAVVDSEDRVLNILEERYGLRLIVSLQYLWFQIVTSWKTRRLGPHVHTHEPKMYLLQCHRLWLHCR